jgi:hypothetical protein
LFGGVAATGSGANAADPVWAHGGGGSWDGDGSASCTNGREPCGPR